MTSRLARPLLTWYRDHARVLPWRQTSDPYAIWVSEIMLQQTRVEEGGDVACSSAELMRLPGIGRYTAAVIAAFAFGADEAALDGNLRRVSPWSVEIPPILPY